MTFGWDGQLFVGNPTVDILVEKLLARGFNEFATTQWLLWAYKKGDGGG